MVESGLVFEDISGPANWVAALLNPSGQFLITSSIIITTRQQPALLAKTLDSLAAQSERDFEVIVVCDGESPRTRAFSEAYRAKYPLHWVCAPENCGLASARNAGADAANGKILLFLDDNTSACPEWLAHHCRRRRAIENSEQAVVLGRCHEVFARPPLTHCERLMREARERSLSDFDERCTRLGSDYSWFPYCGMNSSIPRSTFLQAGGYDSALPLRYSGQEDVELGTRLVDRGVRLIYEPAAIVHHHNPNFFDHHLRLAELIGRSDLYRVLKKQQRNAQTQRLTSLHHSRRVRRMKERLAWEHPEAIGRAAEVCRKVTDLTGSKFFWRYWSALATSVGYWNGVKSEGMTPDFLSSLVGSPVPALLFHSISVPCNKAERSSYVTPQRFLRFAAWLTKRGYRSLRPEEWLAGKRPARRVILTFDDGYDDFYTEAFPVLERFGLSAIVFVVVDQIGKSNSWDEERHLRSRRLLTPQEIRELHRHGVAFGSHTLTHPILTLLSDKDLRREVFDSKSRLEDLLGSEVTCFAYPFGYVDSRVRAAVSEAGYKIAMSAVEGLNFWDDALWMRRIMVFEDSQLSFALKVASGRSVPQDMLQWLLRHVRTSLNAIPGPVGQVLKRGFGQVYGMASDRWWHWK